ncbi:flagellar biosynthetic protein FliR, partial [Candidatus Poribacteria bacterium]|nr:flagellar biosynthetic protein FliR [Candidatus Poribacteria bacterium]
MFRINIDNIELVTFLLVFFRTGAVLLTAPLFSRKNIPVPIRILIPFMLSVILTISMRDLIGQNNVLIILNQGTAGLAVAVFGELLLGISIGFTAQMTFMALYVAGRLVGQEIGFGMARILDPSTQENTELIGQYNTIIAILIFLVIRGHHYIIRAIAWSFSTIQLGQQWINGNFIGHLNNVFAGIFSTGLRIALPVMGTLFLAKIAMGIIARTMPQMNVFIVGFPLQIAVGLITMAISLPFFVKI